jgi:hypothetical protein
MKPYERLSGADLQALELYAADKIAFGDCTPNAKHIISAVALFDRATKRETPSSDDDWGSCNG